MKAREHLRDRLCSLEVEKLELAKIKVGVQCNLKLFFGIYDYKLCFAWYRPDNQFPISRRSK